MYVELHFYFTLPKLITHLGNGYKEQSHENLLIDSLIIINNQLMCASLVIRMLSNDMKKRDLVGSSNCHATISICLWEFP